MDVADLYGLPLDHFIPQRASLVRELRSGGEREQAAVVAALRKPSVAAWAVNQLTRTRRREVDALFRAGDALRDVQAGVLGGSADARDLRSAAEQERAAVDALVDIARGLLSSGGHELSVATTERVAETLHAAALDDNARRQVREGRLVRELRHAGLGAGLGGAVAAPSSRPASSSRPARTADTSAEGERHAVKERKAAEATQRREREEARKQARAFERDAAREVDRAGRALRTAQERESRAAEALRQAQAGVQDAEAGVEAATAAHRQARQRLDGV